MSWSGAEPRATGSDNGERFASILNCTSGAPFLGSLAAAVLSGAIWNEGAPEPADLPALTIYLPSLSAVEPLKLAFLSLSPNGATFLPRIRVLGEPDPLEMFASFGASAPSREAALALLAQALEVPPALPEFERRLQLTALVLKASKTLKSDKLAPGEPLFVQISPAGAFAIAGRIAALMEEFSSDGADLERLRMTGAGDASGGEQLSSQLLSAVLKAWRGRRAKAGRIGKEERRDRLMALEAEFIRLSGAPVIIAGSTGSVAATSGLMQTVCGRKNGAIVLAGLDRHLDAESWAAVAEHPEHPQHGLQQLLARLGVAREDVVDLELPPSLPSPCPSPLGRGNAVACPLSQGERDRVRGVNPAARATFLSEALRPASTTAKWRDYLDGAVNEGASILEGLSLIEAENIQEEAEIVALILRESLETPRQTAALVTPDDALAQRVRHCLAGLSVIGDESRGAGADGFAAKVAACAAGSKPEDLVALLRHAPGAAEAPFRRAAELIDLGALRQMWRPTSMMDLPAALSRAAQAVAAGEARHPAMVRVAREEWEAAGAFAQSVLDAISPLLEAGEATQSLANWAAAHTDALSYLADLGLGETREESRRKTTALDALANVDPPDFTLDLAAYSALFAEIVTANEAGRARAESPHPRIHFWRPLDARLLSADVIVLAGLNEGTWPPRLEPDPWLNRQDRAFAGLSAPERRTGQAAQDFAALAAGAPQVYLTRSRTANGSLARPSRWLSRIRTLASGAGQPRALEPDKPWAAIARERRAPRKVTPCPRPEPRPPVAARPRRLSVTALETLLANPYAIYARYILGLDPLRRIDERADARDKGILIHAALHAFFETYPFGLPADAASALVRELDEAAEALGFDLSNAPFWRPRFERFARWFVESEAARREGVASLKSEVGGRLSLDAPAGRFEITARADRIDALSDGALRIYDFKTSANAARQSNMRDAPQLALEGLLAREGAFAGAPPGANADLAYVIATGGEPPGELLPVRGSPAEIIQKAQEGALALIARFDDPAAPYAYLARAIYKDKAENDPYAHLARVAEWSLDAPTDEDGDD